MTTVEIEEMPTQMDGQDWSWIGAEMDWGMALYRFAVPLDPYHKSESLSLYLRANQPDAALPIITPQCLQEGIGAKATINTVGGGKGAEAQTIWQIRLTVSNLPATGEEDELAFLVHVSAAGSQLDCRVLLRRSACKLSTALLTPDLSEPDHPASPTLYTQTRSALLWHGWRRYAELVGLKRITTGMSGSDVLVFRPRLLSPAQEEHPLWFCGPDLKLPDAWGSPILVKTGLVRKIDREWERYQMFLTDRLQPFMARNETLLAAQPADAPKSGAPSVLPELRATLLGSFLGGDLVQAEPLRAVVRAGIASEQLEQVVGKLYSATGIWYATYTRDTLRKWNWMFRWTEGGKEVGLLERLRDKQGRKRFTDKLAWSIPFIRNEHFAHLLDKGDAADSPQGDDRPTGEGNVHEGNAQKGNSNKKDRTKEEDKGLLSRLMDTIEVRYSLIHGDLHADNVLVDAGNIWLLDWGATGIGPTLYDFAKLEVYLRLRCLEFQASLEAIDRHAANFERLLLDQFTATAFSHGPIHDMAPAMGIDPHDLVKVARCISAIRHQALPHCSGYPDRRDYLAVLYFTVLESLHWANPTDVHNYRLLLELFWILEDTLSRIVGMKPYARMQGPAEPQDLLNKEWLVDPGAPQRVVYWLSRPDGQKALEPVAATRGVLQGDRHHLDVYDHTLLVLAYIEEILAHPVESFCDPIALDSRVEESLRRQQITLPPPCDRVTPLAAAVPEWARPYAERLGTELKTYLDANRTAIAKWLALFHDVGKTATRVLHYSASHAEEPAASMRPAEESKLSPAAAETDVAEKRTKIQFIGHEAYSAQLVVEHVERLFPDDAERERLLHLIRRHHLHFHCLDNWQRPGVAEQIHAALETGTLTADQEKFFAYIDPQSPLVEPDFPLLVLHGYADILACRSALTAFPMQRVAEMDIVLLTLYFERDRFLAQLRRQRQLKQEQERLEREFTALSRQVIGELGLQGSAYGEMKAKLHARFMAACSPEEPNETLPTATQMREWAQQIRS